MLRAGIGISTRLLPEAAAEEAAGAALAGLFGVPPDAARVVVTPARIVGVGAGELPGDGALAWAAGELASQACSGIVLRPKSAPVVNAELLTPSSL